MWPSYAGVPTGQVFIVLSFLIGHKPSFESDREAVTREAAVLDAYGLDAKKDLLAQLLELNLAVAARIDQTATATGMSR
jgi:hypothetical protein